MDRKFRTIAIVALVVAIAGTSIAFAALSRQLNINGEAAIQGTAGWDVKYDTTSLAKTISGASEVSTPTLTGTTFTFGVFLTKPTDSVEYTFDVVNDGTINAKVSSVPVFSGITSDADNYIEYSITYANGDPILVGDELDSGDSATLKVNITFKDVTTLPDNEINLENIAATIVYVQN